MKVAIIGRSDRLYRTTRKLVDEGHSIPIIVTCEAEDHYERTVDDFRKLADELNAEFRNTTDINSEEMISLFERYNCPVAISVNWKTIISIDVLSCFEEGVINCHAGNLPRYRGNAAPNWAIIANEDEIVYTLHYMSEELDAGPILLQRSMTVESDTKIRNVYEFGAEVVPDMFVEAVAGIENSAITPQPQPVDESKVLRCYPRIPKDSELDWVNSADKLERIVRASSEPLFGAYTYLNSQKLRIWEARAEHPDFSYHGSPGQVAERHPESGEITVVTGDGFLVLEEVQLEGKDRQFPTEVIQSVRTRLGMDITGELEDLLSRVQEIEEDYRHKDTK